MKKTSGGRFSRRTLAERGIVMSLETIRRRALKVGDIDAAEIRR
ncbi:MAG: hypothetical protein AAF371_20485 [Pseudomonadota bacterium]